MTTSQLVVTILGIIAIAWVNFYFFVAGRPAAVASPGKGPGPQRVRIEVMGDHDHGGGKGPG